MVMKATSSCPFKWVCPVAETRFRAFLDQMVDDGEIVRSKVPDDVHIVLEKAEIHPGGIVVVQFAERAVVQKLADLLHRPSKQEGVIDHDLQVLLFPPD